jgi:hypothetical protein
MGVECATDSQTLKWYETFPVMVKEGIFGGGVATNRNPYNNTFGQFFVATDGIPTANQQNGELWLSYCIEFEEASDLVTALPYFAAVTLDNFNVVPSLPMGNNQSVTDTSGGSGIVGDIVSFGPGFSPGDIVRLEYLAEFTGVLTGTFNTGSVNFFNCAVLSDGTSNGGTGFNDPPIVLYPGVAATSSFVYTTMNLQLTGFDANLKLFQSTTVFPAACLQANLRITLLNATAYNAKS